MIASGISHWEVLKLLPAPRAVNSYKQGPPIYYSFFKKWKLGFYHQCHYEDSKVVTSSYSWSLSFVGHRWYRTAFIQAKNWPYKRDVLTSMHFTITNPHLVLFGCSKFCPYIQNCPYKGVSPYLRWLEIVGLWGVLIHIEYSHIYRDWAKSNACHLLIQPMFWNFSILLFYLQRPKELLGLREQNAVGGRGVFVRPSGQVI